MLLVITTQCLGFGMAGIVRRFLICELDWLQYATLID